MTPEEAIDFISNKIQIDVRFCSDEDINKTETALKLGISALEKQVAKTPREDETNWAICPACGGSVYKKNVREHIMNEEITFCEHCGQALDWRDTE